MAGLIATATLEQIRAASDIVDVIGAYLPLKRAGANFVTLCPFHKEKSPSFNVNPHRQIFHCFGCHKGGDVFTFVKEYENITFVEAVRRLAERARIPLEFDRSPGQQQARYLKETLLQIHEQITQRWQGALNNDAAGQIARDYLAKRGVPAEAVKLFRLGYAPDAWDDTVNWARSKGHELALVEQAGLIIRKPETGNFYDRFRGRLMFPICDEQGRVIAFSGRVLSGDVKTGKYVNSPETPIFTKGKVFFGLDKSKRPILDAGFAIICEGQLDLIACYMAGVQNIVAPQGTAFTPEHARILKRYVDEVVLCFDSDNAGQAAAARVQESLLASGLAIRVITIPAPHDPDSFIKERGGAAFQELVAGAKEFFDFYLNHLCATQNPATDKGQLAVVKGMAEMLHKTGDLVLADKYAQKTAMELAKYSKVPISPEAVLAEFKKASRPPARVPEALPASAAPPSATSMPSWNEFQLMRLLLRNDDHVAWIAAHLDLEWLPNPTAKLIVARRLEAHAKGTWTNATAFLEEFQNQEAAGMLLTSIFTDTEPIPNPERQLNDILVTLRNAQLNVQLRSLRARSLQPDLSDAEASEILNAMNQMREAKKKPLTPLAP